jgi:hypothetical protein
MDKIKTFIERMKKIGIEVQLSANYPWIYIDSVNGNRIEKEDYFRGNHGFTIAFLPIRINEELNFTDISRIFNLIRKYR